MKKMFTTEKRGLFAVEAEGAVYSFFDDAANRYTFFDAELNELQYDPRLHIRDNDAIETEDPDFVEEAGEGFYLYTTHEVLCDVDGIYGLFGLKFGSGEKLTEEKYRRVGRFCNGLCAVCGENGKWGCIDTKGNPVIPCTFCEAVCFNQYGVAVGDNGLIDRSGNEIPGVEFNSVYNGGPYERYFAFTLLNEERCQSIDACGTAPNITVDIYDTKNRAYAAMAVPECRLYVYGFEGEREVIAAAVELLDRYDEVSLYEKGTILCEKDGFVTVYDYYR